MNAEIAQNESPYSVDVRVPKKIPQRLEVSGVIHIGSDPRNDIIVSSEEGFAAKQFIIRQRSNIVVATCLHNPELNITLNQKPMMEGKSYIVERGDIITLKNVEIYVRQEANFSMNKTSDRTDPRLKIAREKSSAPLKNMTDLEQPQKKSIMKSIKGLFGKKNNS